MTANVRPHNWFARSREAREVLAGVTLLGTQRVNFYAITEGRSITLVDCGFDGHWRYLEAWLAATRRTVADVEAVVLTHGHADHVGFAARLAARGVPVHLHRDDAAFAAAPVSRRPPQRLLVNLWRPRVWSLFGEAVMDGVFQQGLVTAPQTFVDGTLDVPGRLGVVQVPGHSAGSVALYHAASGGLFTGDALMTRDPMLGHEGPLVFAEHTSRTPDAFASLAALRSYAEAALLPALGEPMTDRGGVGRAIEVARMV